jgi:hypothetical protein
VRSPEWSAVATSGGPSARSDHTWTADGSGGSAYLFGGLASDGPSAELWRYDLTAGQWSELTSADPGPEPRFGHTATWVDGVGLVVWSGQGASGFFDDIWAFDPASGVWRQLPASGDVPAARYGSCAALGPDGRLWISHGFTADSGRFSDTRAYDFASGAWEDVTPQGDVPVKRCLHDCFWSEDGSKLILYGGQTTGVPALGDIWALDVGTAEWQARPASDAPARQLYALAALKGTALVFGGGALDHGYLSDTWTIDEQTLELRPLDVEIAPPPRSGASLIADAKRDRVLLFGGLGDEGQLEDLWELEIGLTGTD